jgi:hypothetical protein
MSSEKASLPWGNMVRKPVIDHDSLIYVSRDPCPKCGVRADLGCKHTKRKP